MLFICYYRCLEYLEEVLAHMNHLNQFLDPEVDQLDVNVAMMKEMNITLLIGNFILFIYIFWL
jgi:hypothetical protein